MSVFFAILMIIGLWLILRDKATTKAKTVTLKDIRKKYPKRKSQEQMRREAEELESQMRFEQLERQQLGEAIQREQDLIGLVRDRKTADRLLQSLKRQYPKKGRLWIAEKAISDIHRDRRAY